MCCKHDMCMSHQSELKHQSCISGWQSHLNLQIIFGFSFTGSAISLHYSYVLVLYLNYLFSVVLIYLIYACTPLLVVSLYVWWYVKKLSILKYDQSEYVYFFNLFEVNKYNENGSYDTNKQKSNLLQFVYNYRPLKSKLTSLHQIM